MTYLQNTLYSWLQCSINYCISKFVKLWNQMTSKHASLRFCICCLRTDLPQVQFVSQCQLWRKANAVPILKSHPPKSVYNDMRPISFRPNLSKILKVIGQVGWWILPNHKEVWFEKIRRTPWSNNNSCSDWHHTYVAKSIKMTTTLCKHYLLVVDYSKALDHVYHLTVSRKMAAQDIHLSLLK